MHVEICIDSGLISRPMGLKTPLYNSSPRFTTEYLHRIRLSPYRCITNSECERCYWWNARLLAAPGIVSRSCCAAACSWFYSVPDFTRPHLHLGRTAHSYFQQSMRVYWINSYGLYILLHSCINLTNGFFTP